MAKDRAAILIVGAPRQGKSYFSDTFLKRYSANGGCSVVYNVGKPSDFAEFETVRVLGIEEMAEMIEAKKGKKISGFERPKKVIFFEYNGRIYHFKDFSKMMRGKKIKIERLFSLESEGLFFEAAYTYWSNVFLVIDDAKAITRQGLSRHLVQLFSRANHAGKESGMGLYGVDLAIIFHGFDSVNPELYHYVNNVIQFRTATPPKIKDNQHLAWVLSKNWEQLRQMERYSKFRTNVFTLKSKKI